MEVQIVEAAASKRMTQSRYGGMRKLKPLG